MPAVEPAVPPRLTERHVLTFGLAVSAAFVLAAVGLAAITAVRAMPAWAAIHLAMAGAATVAIGTFMPHFAVTIAGTRPAPAARRLASLALLAAGAALAVLGVTMIGRWWAAIGAGLMIGGIAFVANETMAPLRDPLARRHRIASLAYGVALLELAAGIALGGAAALGIDQVIDGWATLRGSHAWLTLFGAENTRSNPHTGASRFFSSLLPPVYGSIRSTVIVRCRAGRRSISSEPG